MHILLVDDNTENCVALKEILKADGHFVDAVSDGHDALEIMETRDFDAVISDALMPRMDGFALCRLIKSDDNLKNIPVIILTGEYTDDADVLFAKRVGASEVVKKSGNPDEILAAIGRVHGFPKSDSGDGEFHVDLPEGDFLKGYNSVLFHRLETKMNELARANRNLAERNAQLERERRKYRQLFLSANDGILLVSQADFSIVEMNVHAKKIFRFKENSPVTQPSREKKNLHELKPFGEMLVGPISRGEQVRVENSYIAHGARVYLDISGAPVGTEDNLYLVILRDITQRRGWLERFISMDKLRALGRLSQGLVHEIRNPLNVISINLQFLKRDLADDSSEKKFVSAALEGVSTIDRVIREMMSFAQPLAPAKSQFKLTSVLAEIALLAKTTLQKAGITLEIDEAGVNDMVVADRTQVLHALLNLVQNSIEAMPNGGNLSFRLKDVGDELILQIIDTGSGMDDEELKLAVEPFYSTKEGATGMGLSISNRLFELNGASLLCESKSGEGTKVTVFFHRGK